MQVPVSVCVETHTCVGREAFLTQNIYYKAPFQVLQTKVLPDPRHQGSRARTGESSSVLALDAGTTQTPGTAGGKDADVLRK